MGEGMNDQSIMTVKPATLYNFKIVLKLCVAGDMAELLGTLAALPNHPGSTPSTTWQVTLSATPILGHLTASHRHTCRKNTNAHQVNIKKPA